MVSVCVVSQGGRETETNKGILLYGKKRGRDKESKRERDGVANNTVSICILGLSSAVLCLLCGRLGNYSISVASKGKR